MTKVLVVDDGNENRQLLQALFSRYGYTVATASNGAEALEMAQQFVPDLVISDLLMPVMDGFTFLRRWKLDPAFNKVPFIIYTAMFVDVDDKRFGDSMGADAYILKPMKPAELMRKTQEVLVAGVAASPNLADSAALHDDKSTLKFYSDRLLEKLEANTLQLEVANRSLRKEIKAHQKAEEESRFHLTILQTQLETSLEAIMVVSREGCVLSYNNQMLDLWGIPRELLESCRDKPLLQSAEILSGIKERLEDPGTYLRTIEYLHKHDKEKSIEEIHFRSGKIIELYSAPAIGPNEHIYGRVWYYRDITERQRTKASLEASLREQRQLMEQLETERSRLLAAQQIAKVGTWQTDLATMAVSWSDETCRIFGTEAGTSQHTHQTFLDLVHPEDRAVVDRAFKDSLTHPEACRLEHRLLLPDGKIKYVEENWRIYTDEQGNPARALGTCLDITRQREVSEELARNTSLLRIAGRTARIGGWSVDIAAGRMHWSDGVCILHEMPLGSTPTLDEAFGFYAPEFQELIRDAYSHCLDEGIPFDLELQLITAKGRRIWVRVISEVLDGVNPNGRQIQGAIQDINEQKLAEAQLAYLNRVRAVRSGISELIVRVKNREELFREACQIAYKAGEFRMVMLCMVNPDTRAIDMVAHEGKDVSLVTLIRTTLATPGRAVDTMIARAIAARMPVVSSDLENDSRVLFAERYRSASVQSIAVLPLLLQDEAIGAVALYASEQGFFQKDEMNLLAELADDIAFAVDHVSKKERLDYLANFDTLTGLANRELFIERLDRRMRVAAEKNTRLCVALINLARFKSINDTLGRGNGDVLLQLVSEWLVRGAGEAEQVARFGADQFAIVFEIKPTGDLIKLWESLNRTLEENRFMVNDTSLRIAARSGIAIYPDDGTDTDTLLRNAEVALKGARARNQRFMFYTSDMNITVASRLLLENQLRQAVSREEFVLYYQPKLSLSSGQVIGAEALIRWHDPEGNLVLPGKFIPVLEETGMIGDVGSWALGKAMEDYSRWKAAGLPVVRIAVNVSPLQLNDRSFTKNLEQVVRLHAIENGGLELEITESVIMNDVNGSTAILQAIRAMGVTIAIDDFGTGFSSLGYLAKLPLDSLKVDRAFVADMTTGPEGLALVSTIIGLAHALNLKVVAEGVETDEQMRLLRLLKCDEMQGYVVSGPVPAEEFERKYLREGFVLAR